jgi:cell division transport system ATP-binding protein
MPAVPFAPPSGDVPFIDLQRVSKKYGAFRLALADVSLAIARSEFVLVTGAGGAGKSALLRLLSAQEAPSSGTVRIGGEEPARLRPNALAFLRRSMGIVPQVPPFLEDRSILENVMLPALVSNHARQEAESRARAALARLQFEDTDATPRELSASARQRAALARAIVNRPALLVVDDPTAHLDAAATAEMFALLQQFAVSGVTVILACQAPPAQVPDRVRPVRLDHGRVVP